MAALIQAVPAVLWLIGGWAMRDQRRAALHWSAFSALSVLSFLLFVLAKPGPDAPLAEIARAAGNVSTVLAMIALHRGIWLFIGRPLRNAGHLAALAAALLVSWAGLDGALAPLRIAAICGVLALVSLGIARDLHRHARGTAHMRRPWLLSAAPLIAVVIYAGRGLRALLVPGAVPVEMAGDSILNITSAFVYAVVVPSFHATLMALVVTRLVADLQRLSRHDGLTGLLNRRALEEALAAQLQRSRRNAEPFCLLMLDVDHFKRINDRFGHAVGDQALKHLSGLLLDHVREVDRVGRFGGEEFVVLLPGLTLAAALPLAERLRQAIAAEPLAQADAAIELSASIGIAEWGGAREEPSRLLVRADAALYQAKQHGRDRVASAGADPVAA
jgi:diguanylate cyclase (GGDEF)-like protein